MGIGHLFYFTSLQLIIYSDRSLMAALLPQAKLHLEFNEFEGGLLGSGFMLGFMLMSPFVSMARGPKAVTRTIGISLLVWMLAMVTAGLSTSYQVLLLARVTAGAGEAGFCSLAPPIIDDTAPPSSRSFFVAIYYSGVFVGMAAGFLIEAPFASWTTGRYAFFGEALMMAPYCIFILLCGSRFHVMSVEDRKYTAVSSSDVKVPQVSPQPSPKLTQTTSPKLSAVGDGQSLHSGQNFITIVGSEAEDFEAQLPSPPEPVKSAAKDSEPQGPAAHNHGGGSLRATTAIEGCHWLWHV